MIKLFDTIKFIVCLGIFFSSLNVFADAAKQSNQLERIEVKSNVEKNVDIFIEFSTPPVLPKSFSIENPPVLVLDFPGVKSQLTREMATQTFANSFVKGISVVETDTKTRVSIDLDHGLLFNAVVQGNVLKVSFEDQLDSIVKPEAVLAEKLAQIKSFDFRRGERGEGQLVLDLSTPKLKIDVKDENGAIKALFFGVNAPDVLVKKYDVLDFATLVRTVTIENQGNNAVLLVDAASGYDLISYQIDNQFILEIRDGSVAQETLPGELSEKYTGEKISLNFQDISVRAVLQIIADFSGFNIITDDTVKGNVTLRLQNVPWDQALAIILRSKGLSKQQYGNVYLVGPVDQMVAREKVELEEKKQLEDLGPIKSELIQINYAVAQDIATILKDKSSSLLTARGTVTVDKRTNNLLIQDVEARLNDIKILLKKLDIPVRQVEISTQIVSSSITMEEVFGVRLGGGANLGIGSRRVGVGNNLSTSRAIADYPGGRVPPSAAVITPQSYGTSASGGGSSTLPQVNNTEGLFSDLGAGNFTTAYSGSGYTMASVGLAIARLPNGTLLDLELDALQYESRSKTLARPKIITQDKSQASVEQGVDIPYQQATSSGATSVAFKSASLKLDVTPQITPDDKISLDLSISNDTQGATTSAGPAINTNRLQTKILADNGETVVLGGVLSIADNKLTGKVPFLGDLPLIGGLFRNRYHKYAPQEIIVFLTPKIINPPAAQP
jgi:type IV pilus assembly protein PilQ